MAFPLGWDSHRQQLCDLLPVGIPEEPAYPNKMAMFAQKLPEVSEVTQNF